MSGYRLTGVVTVDGVVADGVIDGVAFGLFWKDDLGVYHHHRSTSDVAVTAAAFVGMWPIGVNCNNLDALTPQVRDGHAREQVRSMIFGAKYLGNGCYLSPPESGQRLP